MGYGSHKIILELRPVAGKLQLGEAILVNGLIK